MTSMSGDMPNERWEGDLEADQLDELAAREGREDMPPAGPTYGGMPAGEIPNERWKNDLEADELDREAAEEAADERGGGLM